MIELSPMSKEERHNAILSNAVHAKSYQELYMLVKSQTANRREFDKVMIEAREIYLSRGPILS